MKKKKTLKKVEFYESGRYRHWLITDDPLGWLQTHLRLSERPRKHTVEHNGCVFRIKVKRHD